MALHAAVIAALDERSSRQAADRLVSDFTDAGRRAGVAFSEELARNTAAMQDLTNRLGQNLSDGFRQHGQRAGRGFGEGFGSELVRSLPVASGFASAMSSYESAAGKAGAVAGRALGLAFTTAAAGVIGAAGYTIFKGFERYEAIDAAKNRLENLNRTLESTGKAGLDVKAVMDTVNETVLGTPFALDKAFSIATRALASNTGDLKRFMTDVADAAGFAGEPIQEIGEAFLKIANQGKVSMDELGNELQNIPIVPWLQETLKVSGADLAQLIHDNKVGLDDLLKTIEQHASGFAKASGDTIAGAMENMQTAVARLGANFLGAIFGKPAEDTNQLKDALQSVTERLDEVGAWVNTHQEDIRRIFQQGAEAAREIGTALGTVLDWLNKIPGGLTTVVEAFAGWKALTVGQGALAAVSTMLAKTLPASAATGAGGISAALAGITVPAWLTYLVAGGSVAAVGEGLQDVHNRGLSPEVTTRYPYLSNPRTPGYSGGGGGSFEGPFGTRPDQIPFDVAPANRRGIGGPAGPGPAGGPILPPIGAAGDGKKGPRLPPAPSVAYDTTLPPGFAQLPQTSAILSAENAWMDARHAIAEKQARLNQLEQDNNATVDDITNVKNEIIDAQQQQQQAELRLYDAAANLYDKNTKQLQGYADQMGEIGAKLDQDFGISKGLPGIAENLTKFLANLAFAPVLGAMRGAQAGLGFPGETAGGGIIGALASSGAFGPQFQPTSIYAQRQGASGGSGLGPAMLMPGGGVGYMPQGGGYAGDAALLANVPTGSYSQTGSADLTQGLGDCSSAVEDLVNILDNRPTAGRSMSTGNEAEWLTSRGFLPGTGGPGDFRVGFNAGHTQATLPGGTPFNWGSDAAAAQRGIGGTGASDPAFTSHFYRPVGGGGSGLSPQQWNNIAGAEASGNWQANTGNGYSGGLQFSPSTWDAYGGGQYAPQPWQATPGQQMAIGNNVFAGQGSGAWPATSAAHPDWFQTGVPTGPAGGAGLPAVPAGFGGTGFGNFATGGPGVGPTLIGGMAPPQGTGKGGIGISGGILGAALGAAQSGAGMAVDMVAPGAGGAASALIGIGVQEINRAVQYGSQIAGDVVQGIGETFIPKGASELAQKSWFSKILGGIIGATPILPNVAGGGSDKSKGLTPEQQKAQQSQITPEQVSAQQATSTQHGGAAGQAPGPVNNITVNNQRATEDGTGKDVEYHLGQAAGQSWFAGAR